MSSEEEANFLANYLGDLEKETWRMTWVNLLQVVVGHMGMVWYGMYCGCRIWICCFVDWPVLQFGSGFEDVFVFHDA